MPTLPIDLNFPGGIPVTLNGGLGLSLGLGTITLAPITLQPIQASAGITLAPITLNPVNVNADATVHLDPVHLSIDNLPPIRLALEPIRCHIPVNMAVGFSLFGKTIACLRFFGETQFIAEPYKPNPCESCPPALEK